MEHSFYTTELLGDTGEHILFNTLHGSLAVLDDEVYRQYCSCDGSHLSALASAGFVLEDAHTEVVLQHAWFERVKRDTDTLALCLAPSYSCNLACPHCYEKNQDIEGQMSEEVCAGIETFVKQIYERDHFSHLFISWYGGEPTLNLELIEELSDRLIAFSTTYGIHYGAEIITNATLIDDTIAKRLAACRIGQAMPTLAGAESLHNERRPSKGEGNSYQQTCQGIDRLRNAGIDVLLSLNMDKASYSDFQAMREWIADRGVQAMPTMINDYLGDLASKTCTSCEFELFTREEFSSVLYDWGKAEGYSAETLRELLSPIQNYCRGQLENYFTIDARGDVYKCDGRMGYPEYSLFNIRDLPDIPKSNTAHYNPMDDPLCATCLVLPLCKGQCAWERDLLDDGCHPLKYTLTDYLLDYRNCFGAADEPFTLLVPPRNLENYFSNPNLGSGLTASYFAEDEAK